uniref:Lipocalin n=1 Tax=Rhipicephalus appendiculatus TaxID=34631 RepID=A0A131YCG9_RHIAP
MLSLHALTTIILGSWIFLIPKICNKEIYFVTEDCWAQIKSQYVTKPMATCAQYITCQATRTEHVNTITVCANSLKRAMLSLHALTTIILGSYGS